MLWANLTGDRMQRNGSNHMNGTAPDTSKRRGEILTRLRGTRTREAVARATGIKAITLKTWESGGPDRITKQEDYERLATYYGVSIDAIEDEARGGPPAIPRELKPDPTPTAPAAGTLEATASPLELNYLHLALKGLRGRQAAFLQQAIQLAAAATDGTNEDD